MNNNNNVLGFNRVRMMYRRANLPNRAAAALYLGVTERTIRNWESANRAPGAVEKLLTLKSGDLSPIGWDGWVMSDQLLYSPDKWEFSRGRIMASFFIEQLAKGQGWLHDLDLMGFDQVSGEFR